MRRGGWLLLIVLLGALGVQAQDDAPVYRLREPEMNDYLTMLNANADRIIELRTEVGNFFDAMSRSWNMQSLTLSDARSEDLRQTYRMLADNEVLLHFIDPNLWVSAILESLLGNIDVPPYRIDWQWILQPEFRISVTPIDFENDGQPEYLLYVERFSLQFGDPDYEAYLIIYHDSDGKIRVTDTPLKWKPGFVSHWFFDSIYPVFVGDINADGQIEWVVRTEGKNTDEGGLYRAHLHWAGALMR